LFISNLASVLLIDAVSQVLINFPKIWEPPQNSRR